jgi:hypothetical protein
MSMNKTIKYVAAVSFLAVLIVGGWFFGKRVSAQSQPTVPTYTIQLQILAVGPDPSESFSYSLLLGQRANGDRIIVKSNRSDTRSTNSQYSVMSNKQLKFMSGIGVESNNLNNNITTWGDGVPIQYDGNRGNCAATLRNKATGDTKVILGFMAMKSYEVTETANQEEWLAPALDCMVIEKTYVWHKNPTNVDAGTPDGITTERAVLLSASAPDDSLFTIAANAVETSPNDYATALGDPPDPTRQAIYLQHQQIRASGGKLPQPAPPAPVRLGN